MIELLFSVKNSFQALVIVFASPTGLTHLPEGNIDFPEGLTLQYSFRPGISKSCWAIIGLE
jgi:hypothetical protein